MSAIDALGLESIEIELGRAYAYYALGESLLALASYDRLLDQSPDHFDALRGKALVLRSMLLPTQALELAAAHPGILTDEEVARLRVDEVAIRVRLTARTPYPDEHRNASIAETLTAVEEVVTATADAEASRALMLDRIVALADSFQAAAAIAAYEEQDDDAPFSQDYVLGALAKAYLQERQPGQALRMLEAAIELDPQDIELKFALVYTYLELERYGDAYELTRALTELPMTNSQPGSAVAKGNEDRMRAELIAGIAEAYGDQLATAQSRFEGLLAEAPNNSDLRHELANVYRWRGWLDRSLYEYRQVLAVDDELLSARIGYAHAQMDAREFGDVDQAVADLSNSYPREPSTTDLARRWQVHNRSELDVSGSVGDSSGATFGSDYYSIDTRWFTQPKGYHFRGFVHLHDGFADFPEGESRRRRIGAGLEYRGPRWTAVGELSAARDGGGELGFAGNFDWRISDQWALLGLLELDSDVVQLRAQRVGLETDVIGLGARFAPHESASVEFGWQTQEYTDNNRIDRVTADGRYRFLNRPRSKLEATLAIEATTSRQQNVVYYSPSRDLSVLAGLRHEFRIFRRYDRSLVQTVHVTSGRYDQGAFAADSIWTATYDIDWRLSDRLTVGVGAERLGQFFDGNREYSTVALARVNARF